MVSGRPADLGFNTVNQISLIADSLAELKKIHVTLKGRKDVAELRTVTHGNAVSIYFRDQLLLLYFKKESLDFDLYDPKCIPVAEVSDD